MQLNVLLFDYNCNCIFDENTLKYNIYETIYKDILKRHTEKAMLQIVAELC